MSFCSEFRYEYERKFSVNPPKNVGANIYSPLQENTIPNHFITITIVGADLCVCPENAPKIFMA
jgi:hypothetical protein